MDLNRAMHETYPWIRSDGGRLFRDKVAGWAEKMGVSYNRIAIKNTSGQWGSCSGRGNLSFCWKLFLMPERVVDYVIIHELSHLRHMDHSKEFWAEVETYCPYYKEVRKNLERYLS